MCCIILCCIISFVFCLLNYFVLYTFVLLNFLFPSIHWYSVGMPWFFHKYALLLTNFHNITFFHSLKHLIKLFNRFFCTIFLGSIQSLCYSLSCYWSKYSELFRVASFSIVLSMCSWKSRIWSFSSSGASFS